MSACSTRQLMLNACVFCTHVRVFARALCSPHHDTLSACMTHPLDLRKLLSKTKGTIPSSQSRPRPPSAMLCRWSSSLHPKYRHFASPNWQDASRHKEKKTVPRDDSMLQQCQWVRSNGQVAAAAAADHLYSSRTSALVHARAAIQLKCHPPRTRPIPRPRSWYGTARHVCFAWAERGAVAEAYNARGV